MEVEAGSNPMTSFGCSKVSATVTGQVNKRHLRSTSAGMHLLCGAYMFGSSRTQRVISLSSCESELHGMVSTLADGLFLRRCAEFVTRATIEHQLLTDSSSARQLAARQELGKSNTSAQRFFGFRIWSRRKPSSCPRSPQFGM